MGVELAGGSKKVSFYARTRDTRPAYAQLAIVLRWRSGSAVGMRLLVARPAAPAEARETAVEAFCMGRRVYDKDGRQTAEATPE
jgi:hypothetical protein